MSDLLKDAEAIYALYRDSPSGSYVETALANDICRDIVPLLIMRLQNPPKAFGFTPDNHVDVTSETELDDE
jgi:hypothetical protein